jgi:hypothetical protein
MIPAARLLRRSLIRLLPALLGALGCAQAISAQDPPGRVARLNDGEGTVVYAPAGDNEWTEANYNRPLTRGDRLWTDKGSRAEIQVGSAAVRMDGQTHLEITGLDDQSAQLSLTQGNLYVHVRDLPDGENFEVDTPNLAFRAAYPGDYRIDVDAVRGTTRVTIHSGTGAVYGATGDAIPLGGGQQVMFRARDLNKVNTQESPPQDGFDRWAAERNRHEDQSPSARYVPREIVGYQQLDAHGQWQRDAELGWVWLPIVKGADWAPYRAGHWEWIEPWGWTWMDDAPWGFAPFHYGRWTQLNSRWAWVPGRMGPHPVYAPALVAFVGSAGAKGSVAWFPLAPGEPFQPGYAVSPLYISSVNRNIVLTANPDYRWQHKPEALTAISTDDFQRGKPLRAGWLRVAANMLTQAQVVPPPPMPGRGGITDHARAVQQARVTPPAAADARQVVANAAPARAASETVKAAPPAPPAPTPPQAPAPVQASAKPPPPAIAPQVQAQAQPAPKPASAAAAAGPPAQVQAKAQVAAAPVPPRAVPPAPAVAVARAPLPNADAQRGAQQQAAEQEQQRRVQAARAEQARRQDQAQREHQAAQLALARKAEQAKAGKRREEAVKLAESARREKTRRAEQARREQLLAKRAEQARHEEQARREQQAKREQTIAKRAEQARREAVVAKREEQQRREAHAQLVEQARRSADRDAQALREQRAQREEQARREDQARRDEQARQELAQARRDAQEREIAQRAAQQRQQQALMEQWRRDHQVLDPQRERVRQRPDLRSMASPSS